MNNLQEEIKQLKEINLEINKIRKKINKTTYSLDKTELFLKKLELLNYKRSKSYLKSLSINNDETAKKGNTVLSFTILYWLIALIICFKFILLTIPILLVSLVITISKFNSIKNENNQNNYLITQLNKSIIENLNYTKEKINTKIKNRSDLELVASKYITNHINNIKNNNITGEVEKTIKNIIKNDLNTEENDLEILLEKERLELTKEKEESKKKLMLTLFDD